MPPVRFDPLQQPKGDDIPDVPVVVPLPNAPGVADPTQDEDGPSVGDGARLSVGAGAGGGSIGLMPELPSSVAPSGMVPMPSVDPAVAPEEMDGFWVPDTVPPKETEPQGPATPLAPPPSKVEPDPAVPELPVPVLVAVTDVPFVPQSEVPPAVEPNGLSPPGSSSVEPKGMPTWPTEPAPPPTGDVAPIPGEPLCDTAGAAARSSIAAAMGSRHRIEISIICSGLGHALPAPCPLAGSGGAVDESQARIRRARALPGRPTDMGSAGAGT
jgi:hypothetical protein